MTRRTLLTALLVISLVGTLAAVVSGALEGGDELWPVSWLAWAPIGYLILLRRPGNGVGRGLLFIGASMGISFLFLGVAVSAAPQAVRVWAELGNVVTGVLPWLGIVWLLLVFPHGDYPGRGERWFGRSLMAFGTLAMLSFAVGPQPMYETGAVSPIAIPELTEFTGAITGDQGFLIVIVHVAAALGLLVRRGRRSAGVERAQYRWLFFGALLFLAITSVGQVIPDDSGALYLWVPAGFAIPVTIGVAVLRYRLFEIDRIISRSVTYASVVGLLGAIFFALVTLMTTVLPSEHPLAVAAATLAAAALFNPIRRRAQDVVGRRFNRTRYDAALVMADFAGSLRDSLEVEPLVAGWAEVVASTMQPVSLSVWVRQTQG